MYKNRTLNFKRDNNVFYHTHITFYILYLVKNGNIILKINITYSCNIFLF